MGNSQSNRLSGDYGSSQNNKNRARLGGRRKSLDLPDIHVLQGIDLLQPPPLITHTPPVAPIAITPAAPAPPQQHAPAVPNPPLQTFADAVEPPSRFPQPILAAMSSSLVSMDTLTRLPTKYRGSYVHPRMYSIAELTAPPPSRNPSPAANRHVPGSAYTQVLVRSRLPRPLAPGSSQVNLEKPLLIQITWTGGGEKVFLARAGDDDWSGRQPMTFDPTTSTHTTTMPLPVGTHHYRFLIDEQWRVADDLPTAVDDQGSLANYVAVALDGQSVTGGVIVPASPQKSRDTYDIWHANTAESDDELFHPPQVYPSPTRHRGPASPAKRRQQQRFQSHDLRRNQNIGWTTTIPLALEKAADVEEKYNTALEREKEEAREREREQSLRRHRSSAANPNGGVQLQGTNARMTARHGDPGVSVHEAAERGRTHQHTHIIGFNPVPLAPPPPPLQPPPDVRPPAVPRELESLILNGKNPTEGTKKSRRRDRERGKETDRDHDRRTRERDSERRERGGKRRDPIVKDYAVAADVFGSRTPTSNPASPTTPRSGNPNTVISIIDTEPGVAVVDDPSVLSVPSHAVLNHISTKGAGGLLAVATTVRYREKYVTTVFFKEFESSSGEPGDSE